MKIFGKIVEYFLYAVIACAALLVLSSAVPMPGGIKTFVVRSGSMEPVIKTGSVVIVAPRAAYAVGDIITFGPNTKNRPPTTHRIVGIAGTGSAARYTTRGDANSDSDLNTVRPIEVIGKVFLDIPYAGYVVASAQKPWGFAVLIILPAAIIIFDRLRAIYKELKKKKPNEAADLPTIKDHE